MRDATLEDAPQPPADAPDGVRRAIRSPAVVTNRTRTLVSMPRVIISPL